MSQKAIPTWVKAVLLTNALYYGWYLANRVFWWVFPRIEILTGRAYQWPLEFRLLFLVESFISVVVLCSLAHFLRSGRLAALKIVTFVVTINAGMGLRSIIGAHPEILDHGHSILTVPHEYLIPLFLLLLAIANWMCVSHSSPAGRAKDFE